MRITRVLPCEGDCGRRTKHRHLGENTVLVDVWRCSVCGGQRSGPILTQADVKGTQIATDGGERDA